MKNLYLEKKKYQIEINKKESLIKKYTEDIKKNHRKIEIVNWMIIDWGEPPYDTSGSLKTL